jgi:hypothetical protein
MGESLAFGADYDAEADRMVVTVTFTPRVDFGRLRGAARRMSRPNGRDILESLVLDDFKREWVEDLDKLVSEIVRWFGVSNGAANILGYLATLAMGDA